MSFAANLPLGQEGGREEATSGGSICWGQTRRGRSTEIRPRREIPGPGCSPPLPGTLQLPSLFSSPCLSVSLLVQTLFTLQSWSALTFSKKSVTLPLPFPFCRHTGKAWRGEGGQIINPSLTCFPYLRIITESKFPSDLMFNDPLRSRGRKNRNRSVYSQSVSARVQAYALKVLQSRVSDGAASLNAH